MKSSFKQLLASILLLCCAVTANAGMNLGGGIQIYGTNSSTASGFVPYSANVLTVKNTSTSQTITTANYNQVTFTGTANVTGVGHVIGGLEWMRMNSTGITIPLGIGSEGKLENLQGIMTLGIAGEFQLSNNCASGCTINSLVLVDGSITGNAGPLASVTHFLAQSPGNTAAITTEVMFGAAAPAVGTGITNLYGLQIPDMTATNVYGANLGIMAGSQKYNLYISGTAPSYTNGPISTLNSSNLGTGGFGWGALYLTYTNTATVGAVTMNVPSGRVNIAAAGTSIVVTDSIATAASHIFAQASTADVTCMVKNTVPAAGSFTITMTAGCTAQTTVNFFIVNAD